MVPEERLWVHQKICINDPRGSITSVQYLIRMWPLVVKRSWVQIRGFTYLHNMCTKNTRFKFTFGFPIWLFCKGHISPHTPAFIKWHHVRKSICMYNIKQDWLQNVQYIVPWHGIAFSPWIIHSAWCSLVLHLLLLGQVLWRCTSQHLLPLTLKAGCEQRPNHWCAEDKEKERNQKRRGIAKAHYTGYLPLLFFLNFQSNCTGSVWGIRQRGNWLIAQLDQ